MKRQELIDYFYQLDRSRFLNEACISLASYDGPLPIGFGQTISQPTLVLEMTAQLSPEKDNRVLEIGTGSGYQTALLAAFSHSVYTVERIAALSEQAQDRLSALGFDNIFYRIGDGSEGWLEEAPFDRIMVTAAASSVPPTLTEQLKPGGRMIIPVGPRGWQDLILITRNRFGKLNQASIEKVAFVELIGQFGWGRK